MLDLIPYKFLIDCLELDEVYYIERVNYLCWIITCKESMLGRNFSWVSRTLLNSTNFKEADKYIFSTSEKAGELFSTFVEHKKILNQQLEALKQQFNIEPLYNTEDTCLDFDVCVSPEEIENLLKRYSIVTHLINKSVDKRGGVQITVNYISDMLFLEDTLKKIQQDNNYKIINYFNFTQPFVNNNAPLCYYWKVNAHYTRHFTFVKEF